MAPWLRARVVATAREVAAEWGVELGEPFSLSRFALAVRAGDDAVLKVTPAEDDEGDHEADAMELWSAAGGLRVLRRDAARRAMLLERARPGHDMATVPDEEAVAAAVEVGRRIWLPAGAPFRSVHDFIPRWLESERDHSLYATAIDLYERIGRRDDTLVHGDFHHHNLLRHGDRWVAIDAKAMRAEPEYDIPSFLWNPLTPAGHGSMPLERTRRRLELFERAGLDPWRMRAWTAIRGTWLGADEEESATIRALL
jgi:streptomycin 6-kinase